MKKPVKKIDAIELAVFRNRFTAICEEMGITLCRSSFSPNIKERRDYSCAIFDQHGQLVSQAAHIPVHLGSMPMSVQAAIRRFSLRPGDMVILNDPYQGGTHLPDITLVQAVFVTGQKRATFFVANRAHHSDVGGQSPGSMPISNHLKNEGVIIPPTLFRNRGRLNQKWLYNFLEQVRSPEDRKADLLAQQSANRIGNQRLKELLNQYGISKAQSAMKTYQNYERKITIKALRQIPNGVYHFEDYLDDDGMGNQEIKIAVSINVQAANIIVDFSDSASQVTGPLNATKAITLSAVAYVFRCIVFSLTGEDCIALNTIRLKTRRGSVVDARYPAPVAGGNVETSQRIVDVLLGALSQALPSLIPAASQGTMNNIAMGNENFTYYETLAGGMGARPQSPGLDAIHSHMTNTLNTPIESLEHELPLQIVSYRIRTQSGGAGKQKGGNGLIREYRFLEPSSVSILSERRRFAPYGLKGGKPGRRGNNWLFRNGKKVRLDGKAEWQAQAGDILRIETPGGGAYGKNSLKPS